MGERFRTITTNYYRGAHGIIMISNIKTYSDINCQRLLIGNKCDLENDREITKDRGECIALENKMNFYECSAKHDINITNAFIQIAKQIINQAKLDQITNDIIPKMIDISCRNHKNNKKNKIKSCCFGKGK